MRWNPEILEIMAVSEDKLGKICHSWEPFGNVSKSVEKETGLREGTLYVLESRMERVISLALV
ncbi:hypothetical protein MUP77_25880 [Candidatus Bathyarchaeota archaeon]|nr:hypothetical protein [Candidatus Bathyarchaeota archaeon]